MVEYRVFNPVYQMMLEVYVWWDCNEFGRKYWCGDLEEWEVLIGRMIKWDDRYGIWLQYYSIPMLIHELSCAIKLHMEDKWFKTDSIDRFSQSLEYFVAQLEKQWFFNTKKEHEGKKKTK